MSDRTNGKRNSQVSRRDFLAKSAIGAGAAAGEAGAAAAPSASSVRITDPSATLSPSLTETDATLPAAGDGTSIVALSDSSSTSGSSFLTTSPGFTKTVITGTSLKSPMSGTFTSMAMRPSVRAAGCADR